jgi:hypothetical protein
MNYCGIWRMLFRWHSSWTRYNSPFLESSIKCLNEWNIHTWILFSEFIWRMFLKMSGCLIQLWFQLNCRTLGCFIKFHCEPFRRKLCYYLSKQPFESLTHDWSGATEFLTKNYWMHKKYRLKIIGCIHSKLNLQ